jgi:hypothetical protein
LVLEGLETSVFLRSLKSNVVSLEAGEAQVVLKVISGSLESFVVSGRLKSSIVSASLEISVVPA